MSRDAHNSGRDAVSRGGGLAQPDFKIWTEDDVGAGGRQRRPSEMKVGHAERSGVVTLEMMGKRGRCIVCRVHTYVIMRQGPRPEKAGLLKCLCRLRQA